MKTKFSIMLAVLALTMTASFAYAGGDIVTG